MSDTNNTRLNGRVLLAKLNNALVASIFLLGFAVCGVIMGLLCLFISPAFILLIVLSVLAIRHIIKYARNISGLKAAASTALYPANDRQYVFRVEETRDKLMARLIQEGICPWSENGCLNKQGLCFCRQQEINLKEIDLDTKKKEKILLDVLDTTT